MGAVTDMINDPYEGCGFLILAIASARKPRKLSSKHADLYSNEERQIVN